MLYVIIVMALSQVPRFLKVHSSIYHFLIRWRLFRRPIIGQPDRVVLYTQATLALHNYLRTTESSVYCPPGFVDAEDGSGNRVDGAWRTDEEACTGLQNVAQTSSNRYLVRLLLAQP